MGADKKTAWQRYFDGELDIIERVRTTQGDNIMAAAKLIADCTEKGGIPFLKIFKNNSHFPIDKHAAVCYILDVNKNHLQI